MNLHYCIGEKEPEDLNCVNDLRSSRIPLYQPSWEKLGSEDLELGSSPPPDADSSLSFF